MHRTLLGLVALGLAAAGCASDGKKLDPRATLACDLFELASVKAATGLDLRRATKPQPLQPDGSTLCVFTDARGVDVVSVSFDNTPSIQGFTQSYETFQAEGHAPAYEGDSRHAFAVRKFCLVKRFAESGVVDAAIPTYAAGPRGPMSDADACLAAMRTILDDAQSRLADPPA